MFKFYYSSLCILFFTIGCAIPSTSSISYEVYLFHTSFQNIFISALNRFKQIELFHQSISSQIFLQQETSDSLQFKLSEPKLQGITNLKVYVSSSPPYLKLSLIEACKWPCNPLRLSHTIPISSQIDANAGVTISVTYKKSGQLFVHLLLKKEISRIRYQVNQCQKNSFLYNNQSLCLTNIIKQECHLWNLSHFINLHKCKGECIVNQIMKCKNQFHNQIKQYIRFFALTSFTITTTLAFILFTISIVLFVLTFPTEDHSFHFIIRYFNFDKFRKWTRGFTNNFRSLPV